MPLMGQYEFDKNGGVKIYPPKEKNNCILAEELNDCVHFDKDRKICRDNVEECGMYKKIVVEEEKNSYVRKPRWYEKYYQSK